MSRNVSGGDGICKRNLVQLLLSVIRPMGTADMILTAQSCLGDLEMQVLKSPDSLVTLEGGAGVWLGGLGAGVADKMGKPC